MKPHEGRKIVYNCLNYPQVNPVKTLTPLGIVFSHPEMAIVGQSYKQLKDNGIDFLQVKPLMNGKEEL